MVVDRLGRSTTARSCDFDDRRPRRARRRSRSRYTGTVPDPFREGREVIVTGQLEDGTFVAERDSLVTKCPSKFTEQAQQDPEHVVIDAVIEPMVALGAACLIAAGAGRALRRRGGARRRARGPPLGRLVAARGLRALRAADDLRSSCSRRRSCARDFSLALVADHSSTTTPTFYKLTAMWSSQAGSLLLWAWVLSIASSAVLYVTRRRLRELVPWATAVLAGLARLLHRADAARRRRATRSRASTRRPPEGVGLTPLLRHPAMMIHPPMLYSGYVAFSIPFAFAIGALVTRRARRELDPLHAALRADRLDPPRRSGSCSARGGPTPSSAGAATGPGTRSRTRR